VFADQLAHVHQRIHQACQRSQRDPSDVTLVGVTKGMPTGAIREAAACGIRHIGENRAQEAKAKRAELGAAITASVQWHLIGHLQRNKARMAVELFDVIHSVDSQALAEELERHLAARGHAKLILLQVNVSGETTKFGCPPAQVQALAKAVIALPHLTLHGLMTIAPLADDPQAARPHFRRLRELRDELASSLSREPRTLKLSMGMSQDFEVAIEEGAHYVRLGTILFGARV